MARRSVALSVAYNRRTDCLLVIQTPPEAAESEETKPDFFLRYAIGTEEVVGFECLDFSRHVYDDSWLHMLPQMGTFVFNGQHLRLPEFLVELWEDIKKDSLHKRSIEGEMLVV